MSKKTERLFASVALDGESRETALTSFAGALDQLEETAKQQGREVLYDTMMVSTDRNRIDNSSIANTSTIEYVTIYVEADAVRLQVSGNTPPTQEEVATP